MATTTNYGWDTPDDTDLVKDGAAAIRTLGSSIDTTTKNLNPQTTTGALAYRSATANVNTALPVGTTGQVLTVAAGVPSWATPSVGDLTEVQAGVGISVASGTGPIPVITNSSTDLITTAGDLLYGTAADTVARLGIGTANQVLAVNSGATAPEWKTVAASGATLVKRVAFSGVASTGTDFDGVFTSTYGTYIISFEEAIAGTGGLTQDVQMLVRVSGADRTSSTYVTANGKIASGAVAQTFYGTDYDSKFTVSENAYIYGTLQYNKARNFFSGFLVDEISGGFCQVMMYNASSSVDGFKLQCSSGNISGTVAVYGLAK